MKYVILYLIIINLYGIYIMYIDKKRAKERKWRISEKSIFLVALFFGGIGVI
ncbi:hypothetical protein CLHOM_01900 [Clostridium homopropionicum DSM 5847]|uniref:DUF1294 domain-containing protein n=1 Tax=Clostridium homopropionicum DSM 5847 TaxID=1121318 RepID=A0A0L6ZEV3_9CLOT|nr:hypothetical protein CLHOM_01900 [Clostridium homopropionicum DSM 5847]SFG07045.1 Protein of unknown function [Clostridium homopropionicum]